MLDNETLLNRLTQTYLETYPGAVAEGERARAAMVSGGSHTLRLFDPAPFRISSASGAYVRDTDGHEILDFWQGHYANILGHNPPLVTEALSEALSDGWGLQTGITDTSETAFAELFLKLTGAERVRFTTSGSLATLYAIMLARAFTSRSLILKVRGGWQGAQPLALKGVSYRDGYEHGESEGLSAEDVESVVLTRYNDPQHLADCFREHGDRIACFIVEPWMGMGGFMPATKAYLDLARDLTGRHGAVLIFDEIISGFRFCASGVQRLFGIGPDLTTYAKIVGGGMPLAAVAGREEIMRLCGPEGGRRVKFDGGTFSAHPSATLAGHAVLSWLAEHEEEIYPVLAERGERMRRGIEEAFAREGVFVRCTGYGNETVPGSSVGMVHFPLEPDTVLDCPDTVWNPGVCDVVRREQVLKLALLLDRVHVVHGLGALSTEHTDEDLDHLFQACSSAARRLLGLDT